METMLEPAISVTPPLSPPSSARLRAGIALTAVPVAFLGFDGTIKLLELTPVLESFARLGYPAQLARGIGMLELACLVLYAIPRTAVLGAVLLSGFLGGAIATHVRVGDPLLTHVLFPVYVASTLWAGLTLRHRELGALLSSAAGIPRRCPTPKSQRGDAL